METTSTTTDRINEARESLASAQSVLETADAGLSKIETMAEKADSARRRPMATAGVLFVIGLIGTLVLSAVRGE